jgi:hypothetical protein
VAFPLGRPLGAPNNSEFQRDVLKNALLLVEEPEGPVLVDYPHDVGDIENDHTPQACPVDFSTRKKEQTDREIFLEHLQKEIDTMQTWHDIAREKTGRSTAELSGLTPGQIVILFTDFIDGNLPEISLDNKSISDHLRMAAQDLKAFYFEAVSAQPRQTCNDEVLSNWFWKETYAAVLINEVRKSCLAIGTKDMRLLGNLLLIPRNQMHRFSDERKIF